MYVHSLRTRIRDLESENRALSSSRTTPTTSTTTATTTATNSSTNRMKRAHNSLVGTTVYKEFDGSWYKGSVKSFNRRTNLYAVWYTDGDKEECSQEDVEEIVTQYNRRSDRNEMEWIGTKIIKNFGTLGDFTGKVICYEPTTKSYVVEYSDGDTEDLPKKQVVGYANDYKRKSRTLARQEH